MLCVLASSWTWTHQLNGFGGDSAEYLLIAQRFSFFGDSNPAASQFASATSYPPLYPLLLALFSNGQNWLLAHQVTAFCGVAALFVLWHQLRVENCPLIDSLVVVGVIVLVPGFYSQALYIHSEFLFLLFVCLCLYAVSRLERETKLVFVVMASLAATGAYCTRTIGISLVVALVVYVLLRRPKREWAIVVVMTLAPVLGWMHFGQPPGGGYLVAWKERLSIVGSPPGTDIITSQFAALADGYVINFIGQGSTNTAVVLLFSVVCFGAWAFRLSRCKLDALFLGAYFTILVAWPFPAERVRFVLPAVPILVMQVVLSLYALGLNSKKGRAILAARMAVLVLAITIFPTLILTVQRYLEPMPLELESYRRSPEWYAVTSRDERLSAIFLYQRSKVGFEEIQIHVPKQECVFSIKPSLVALFAQRNSYRTPLPNSKLGLELDPDAVACRYVYMAPFTSPTFAEAYYPIGRWAEGMDVIHVTRLIESDNASGVAGMISKIR